MKLTNNYEKNIEQLHVAKWNCISGNGNDDSDNSNNNNYSRNKKWHRPLGQEFSDCPSIRKEVRGGEGKELQ